MLPDPSHSPVSCNTLKTKKMAYQLPPRQHIAKRWLTATLISIYALIIVLVLLLSTDSSGSINSDRSTGFSQSHSKGSLIKKTTGAYSN